MLKVFS